ncbi:hypothetical protein GE061_012146 [Apolygus lucorum]|uniref:Cubilin n=1 Tax=Apolygus lucorum TaxID=248454 RepID=A0A8S9XRR3_APOLU|nr:hypothetical protein GE061_012146 [Apolygus lucorum]
MGASRATWAFLGLMATIASGSSPYSDQPRLESRDGHLLIVGASGANISLQTSQGGQININDEDIIHVLNMARQAAQKVDKWGTTGTGGDSSGNPGLNVFLEPLEKRLTLVEKKMSLSTVDLLTPRRSSALDTIKARQGVRQRFRQLNITVTRLEKNLRSLRTLLETNECASGPCLHGGTCQDMFNSFHCICPDQWEGNICEKDVDECEEFRNTGLGCQNGATCQNLPGSYSCICPPEWYGMHCTKKNRDCKTSGRASLCGNGDCFDTSTGVLCQCYQGWTTDKVTGACTVDIDECAGLTNPCSHDPLVQCENLPGSFKCGPCPIGYAGNGYQCRDIDECFTNNGGCSNNPKVQCVNTRGSRFCGPCPPGYSGDGVSCSRVDDLCQVNRGGCHPLAQCIHNSGLTYVQCRCPVGWVGSGVGENGCTQDNTTATDICPLFYCLNGGTCSISSDRNFRCSCPPGFTGPRCEIGDIVCASQPCQNNGTCIAIPGQVSYKCACLFGYTGDNCEYTSVGCGGNIVASEGTFSFPNTSLESHRLPLTCRWNIRLPNDSLVFNFTVNYNISCYMDFLTIHEGTNFQYPTEKFCGFGLSKNHTTTREFIKVIYEYVSSSKSLWINQIGKFKLSWTSVPKKCGGFIAAKSHGQISSPGFPGYYPNLSRCKWTLSAPPGKRILLTFSDMDIVPHNDSDDALKIFDGPEITETPLATFKQKTIPAPITTSSNEATLLFETDDFGSERGFQIVYSLVEGIPGCGGLLTAPFGRITPPQGHKSDGDLAEQLTCEWKIRMSGRDTIKVETKNFKLEYSDGCKYDSLEFYDGPDTESRLIGRWCGESGPELLKSSGNSMTIVLITDQTYNEGSFTIDYSTVCDIELSTPNGILACWTLDQEHKATMIDDNGNDVESCLYDSLSIYDGDSPNSKLLTELCGNGTISNIISSHNYMLLVFKTDVSGGGRGFKANYTSIENSKNSQSQPAILEYLYCLE